MFLGFRAYRVVVEFGIILRWLLNRNDSGGCGMDTPFPVFIPNPRGTGSSAIRRPE
jgi:hypothetical protein